MLNRYTAKKIAASITLSVALALVLLLFGYQVNTEANPTLPIEIIEDPDPDFFKKLNQQRFEAFKVETNKASNETGKKSAYEEPEPLVSLEELEAIKDYGQMASGS